MTTLLQHQIDRILSILQQELPPPPVWQEPPEFEHTPNSISWRDADIERAETVDLQTAQQSVLERMLDYAAARSRKRALLIKAPPGVGKTWYGVITAQKLARQGKRVMFAMPTREHFENLREFDIFDSALWYPWRSFTSPDPLSDGAAMCHLSKHTTEWVSKGYPLYQACSQLCPHYRHVCPFRTQAQVPEPIIAGSYEHLIYGIPHEERFDVAIIDEMPLRPFLKPTYISLEMLREQSESRTPFGQLCRTLSGLIGQTRQSARLKGRELIDELGDALDEFLLQIESGNLLPAIPEIAEPEDIRSVPTFFVAELATALAREWRAYIDGYESWLSHVTVTSSRVEIYSRPELWAELPSKVILLDATANARIYEALLDREIEVFAPDVERLGSIKQIAVSYVGKSAMTDAESAQAQYWRKVVDHLISSNGYERPALVTFQSVEAAFDDMPTAHYFGQRGSNQLKDCDALFVLGTPSPSAFDIMNMSALVFHDRIAPLPPRPHGRQLRPYRFERDGQQPQVALFGLWHDRDLAALHHALREDELTQALHRARPLLRSVDIWLLTNLPTDEHLDEFYEHIPGIPAGVSPELWLDALAQLPDGELITVASAAGLLDVSAKTIRRNRLLERLVEHGIAKQASIASGKRGRPAYAIRRLTLDNIDTRAYDIPID